MRQVPPPYQFSMLGGDGSRGHRRHIGCSLGYLSWKASRGPIGGSFDASWRLLWGLLGASWGPLGTSRRLLGASSDTRIELS
eukprot:5221087-Pyramimonas_sp.AAC.1